MLTRQTLGLPIHPPELTPTSGAPHDRINQLEHHVGVLAQEQRRLMEALQGMWDTLNRDGALDIVNARINGTKIGDADPSSGAFTTLAVGSSSTFPTGTTTPTVTSQGGTLGTTSASLTWVKIGAYTHFEARVTVTTVGTGTGVVKFTLPTTPTADGVGYGVEVAVNGKQLSVTILNATATANISNYDTTSPIVAGASFQVAGRYKT